MTDISITGVPATDRVPGGYVEILFAQGPASAASVQRDVVFVMPKLAAGSWTAATLYEVTNEQAAIDGAGVGSPLHRGIRKFLQMNKTSKVYALPIAETSGGSPVAGTFLVTIAGAANPTKSGAITVRICDEDCTYSFTTADTPTTIADGLEAIINNKTHLPVSSSNVAGALTITAKLKGISQGNGTVDVIPVRTKIDPGNGMTVTASGAVGDTVAGADGTTTEAANLATSLATIVARRIYYIVSSANDTTSFTSLTSHITSKSEPDKGLRCVGIAAYTGGLAGAQTLANAQNEARFQLVWQLDSDHDSAELAGAVAAIRAKHENTDSTYCFAGYRNGAGRSWTINKQFDEADWATHANLKDAINDGITPIASDASGSKVVISVNTQSKDSSGTYDDFRATETHRVSGADDFADRRLAEWVLNYQGKKLKSDETLADGSVNPNQKQIRGVVRPSYVSAWLKKSLRDFEDEGKSQNAAESIEALRVIRPTTNSMRVASEINLHIIDHCLQGTFRINEVSTG